MLSNKALEGSSRDDWHLCWMYIAREVSYSYMLGCILPQSCLVGF